MPANEKLVPCYNRGCGQMFDPNKNDIDECIHHPGVPVFHDAYKGWSCCNKKTINFTEFLNIKGCTVAKHSNVKPAEPEKKPLDKELDKEVVVVRAPIAPQLKRVPYETPLTTIDPNISASLIEQIKNTTNSAPAANNSVIEVGTSCKNGGCSAAYENESSNEAPCTHHPGTPIFHEGLKFWSCCQKRTTDFNVFLNQPGCVTGFHKWVKESASTGMIKCRWDWHQTPEHVIVSVYAKKYDPSKSYIKLNPIRLNIKLEFPEEGNGIFEIDLELRGVIDISKSSGSMTPSKVEIKLKKAEPGSWSKLDFPREVKTETQPVVQDTTTDEDDLVDLNDVEAVQKLGTVNITEIK